LLSNALLGEELPIALNRHVRRAIASYGRRNRVISIEVIIDATTLERSSRKAQNVGLYHSNGKKITGHRITNIGILLDGKLYVPIAVLVHRTRSFARSLGLTYLTEGAMVCRWLRNNMQDLVKNLAKLQISREDITFLLDAGYDNAEIQRDIREIGCHFTMMVKCSRKIQGMKISEFFRRNRCLSWQTLRIQRSTSNKKKRMKFRIRTAGQVYLHGVGEVVAICSEKNGRGRAKNTRRYLVTSRLAQSGRDVLVTYSRRWAIETWHKKMKQEFGLGDCSASEFQSIENHVYLCLIAYVIQLLGLKSLPANGTSIDQFLEMQVRKKTRRTLTLNGGSKILDTEIRDIAKVIFKKVAA
jgi:Transposase DDE domain